ncbi:hypothetical protein [Treponema sp.]|uniref:hypothetical protein n=1 Tax=Treponema sp. TaxID=166 RepID=UPI00298E09AA|nr:hypothetical protein [Treponema sp.]MCQ2242042.1 hypothetical protein [Treponema sp.]
MNRLEMLTVITGLIMTVLGGYQYKGNAKCELITCLFVNLLLKIIYGLMALLPLYFNYWRR